jgi:hypothetical protein
LNVDRIFDTFNRCEVLWILVGGMNFLLRHQPVLTFDVDLWIEDSPANRARCERALTELDAEWGPSEEEWLPVRQYAAGWLQRQSLYCLTSPHGAIDMFRQLAGLGAWQESRRQAAPGRTAGNAEYLGLSDEDMLRSQYALDEGLRRPERIAVLEQALRSKERES